MTGRIGHGVASLGVAAVMLYLSGCTAVGFGIGSAIDNSSRRVDEKEWRDVPVGSEVLVYTTHDSLIDGRYDGSDYMTPSEYNERLSTWMSVDTIARRLPQAGSTVVLDLKTGDQVKGELCGFDRMQSQATSAKAGREQVGMLVVKRTSNGLVARFDAGLLRTVSADSTLSVSSDRLRELILTEKIPTLSTILVIIDSRRLSIPLDNVSKIEYNRRGAGKWIGMGIGLAMDAGIVAFSIALHNSLDWGGR